MSDPCKRCDEMHRRAQKDEGAAIRYERMRSNLESELARQSKYWRSENKLFKGQWKRAVGMLHEAGIAWDWKTDGAVHHPQRLPIMLQRLLDRSPPLWDRLVAMVKRSTGK